MSTSNRYLLSECDLGQLSTLDESKEKKTILWWMVWQALGASVKVPTESHHVRAILEGSDGWISSWRVDEDAPVLCVGDRDARPSLEAVLEAIHATVGPNGDHLTTNTESSSCRSVFIIAFGEEWEVRAVAEGGPNDALPYLAACRALILWKRGRTPLTP